MKTHSRRTFLATALTGTVASAVAPAALAAEVSGAVESPVVIPQRAFGANDRIRIAVLGVNGRGQSHIDILMKQGDTDVVALCDPDSAILARRAKSFEEKYGRSLSAVQDFRRLYERNDIDAVTLATPNHWHALQTVMACQAGKDVYLEKPATHNVSEGRKIIEAAYRYNRIVQHGVQLRSSEAIREAIRLLRDGIIGRVYMARGLVFRRRPGIGNKGVSGVPAGLDYDLWCGPAPLTPFTENLVHYNWHWHWNYGNGDVGNQGVHETDLCLWGLDAGLPERITSMGGKFLFDDCRETPEVLTSVYHYPKERKIIQFEVRNWCTNLEDGAGVGNIFYGEKGYLVVKGYDTYEVYFGEKREKGPSRSEKGELERHFANWTDAIRSRDMTLLNAPVETAHRASALAHLGNISFRLGRQLHFDPVAERFLGDEEANRMLTREYRPPYTFPETI
ncbi:MAG: Gfo/Idh/MocA family oxidoreductase [Tannerellaceae bacterium]|nr:Gfo/Idh/MocA family oxidoreductase [Tannerellaceae bacterium]